MKRLSLSGWRSALKAVLATAVALVIALPPLAAAPATVSQAPAQWPFTKTIGVAYNHSFASPGTQPTTSAAMAAIASQFGLVRLYGDDSDLTDELKDAQTNGVEVALGTTNDQITAFLTQASADTYVNTYVKPYGNTVKLVILGNEPFLSNQPTDNLVPSLTNLRQAFTNDGVNVLPVTINESFGIVQNSYPPACTTFAPQYAGIASVLAYLQSIGSFILVDIYPYQAYRDNSAQIPLAYAIGTQSTSIGPACGAPGVTEPSLFQAQLDGWKAAMKAVGYPSLTVFIGETGWASAGSSAASPASETSYINCYVQKSPPQTFLFEMYNEDLKGGDESYYGLNGLPNGGPCQ
jgi:exo-beta-1,3-glucanase (GH17 family)